MKPDAPALLEKELSAPNYQPRTIAIGTNTDPYQPIERKYQVMRGILEVLERAGHPVGIVTKSALILRDLDILARLAERNLVKVALSVTTLDAKLARTMEPRAATPGRRLEALRQMSAAGIPTAVMVAPVIPAINDADIERILDAAAMAGRQERGLCAAAAAARSARPVRGMAEGQLSRPRRACDEARSAICAAARITTSTWGTRMKGAGPYAWMIGRRFEKACEKLGLNKSEPPLTTEHFRSPKPRAEQLSLFRMTAPIAELDRGDARRARRASERARFMRRLGFKRKVRATGDEIAFFEAGGVVLALWDWDKLAEER